MQEKQRITLNGFRQGYVKFLSSTHFSKANLNMYKDLAHYWEGNHSFKTPSLIDQLGTYNCYIQGT